MADEKIGTVASRMHPLSQITLIYQDAAGAEYEQSLSELESVGTLIDPESGDDLELVGWRFAEERSLVRAGYASTDAEVEGLRAELDILRATEDGNLSAMRERAEEAEATLAKVREAAKDALAGLDVVIRRLGLDPFDHNHRARVIRAEAALRAILDESPTERETPADCPCVTCLNARGADIWFMVVCATCGNKRCPHAESHENPCTGSNEPGQPGATRYPVSWSRIAPDGGGPR